MFLNCFSHSVCQCSSILPLGSSFPCSYRKYFLCVPRFTFQCSQVQNFASRSCFTSLPKFFFCICKTWLHSKEIKRLYSDNTLPLPTPLFPSTHPSLSRLGPHRHPPWPDHPLPSCWQSTPWMCRGQEGQVLWLLVTPWGQRYLPLPIQDTRTTCKHSIFLHRSAKVMFLFIRVLHSCKKFAFLRS